MHEIITWLIIWSLGVALGGLFFGGLWWTVRKSMYSTRPALWFLSSLLLRMALTLSGFYFVAMSDLGEAPWLRLLLCLCGFITARLLITRMTAHRPILASTNVIPSAEKY